MLVTAVHHNPPSRQHQNSASAWSSVAESRRAHGLVHPALGTPLPPSRFLIRSATHLRACVGGLIYFVVGLACAASGVIADQQRLAQNLASSQKPIDPLAVESARLHNTGSASLYFAIAQPVAESRAIGYVSGGRILG